MPKNTNIAPYYDDFDSLKSFYQILFRPGYAVQARELTQLQSILQDQISKFGNHIFKNGSLVVGAQTTLNRGAKFLKIKSTNNGETILNGGTEINILNFLNKRIDIFDETGTTQVAKAVVTLTAGSDTLIVSEIFGDFSSIVGNAQVRIEGSLVAQDAEIQETAFYGEATTASINEGIFFIDGFFCLVNSQTIVVDYTDLPSKKIGINVGYTIIDDSADSTLQDPAAGFSNYASPGANRLKIELLLETRPIDSVLNLTDFYELMRVENGEILKQIIYPVYSELEKTLARRTFDESGDYTVRPFLVQPFNSFKGTGTVTVNTGTVTGTNTLFTEELATGSIIEADGKEFTVVGNVENNLQVSVTPSSGANSTVASPSRFMVKDGKKINLRISPGKAYVKGFEFETIAPNNILVDKAREIVNVPRHDFSVSYGGYVVCSTMEANFDFSKLENVQLLDYNNAVIGIANIRMVEADGSNYRVYLFNVKMNSGKFFETVRKVAVFGSTTKVASILIDGIGSIVSTGTGNVTVSGTTATGTGTKFLTELRVGSRVVINNVPYNVVAIADDNSLTLSSSATVTIPANFRIRDTRIYGNNNQEWIVPVGFSGMSPVIDDEITPTFANTGYFLRTYETVTNGAPTSTLAFTINSPYEFLPGISNYQLIQIGDPCVDSTNIISGVSVSNSVSNSTVTISTNSSFPAATYALYATVKAESPEPRTKTFRRYSTTISLTDNLSSGRRYTDVAHDFSLHNFKLTLNKSDVINAEKIYLNPVVSGGAITGGEDITSMFTFDNGQRDTHYDHASITLKPEFRSNFPVGNIMVLFNYWEHSRSIGTIVTRSYNDYKKIPTYYSPISGKSFNLRDCVDFRPIVPDGVAISSENLFPVSMFVSFFSEFPLNNSNFEADVAYYLPRKDRLVISKEKRFEVIKGISEENPKLPQNNNDSMTIYNISLNPYTYNQNDLFLEFIENKRFTMRDIGRMEKRINNLEYYTALSLLEKETADLLVRDGAGNMRFKNGFIAENFSGHNIGDVDRADYSCSIDFERQQLRPRFKSRNFKLEHTANTISTESVGNKPVKKGNILLIPYTSNFKLVSQLQASGYINVNPYNVFSWVGQMRLDPTSDVWIETTSKPDVIVNIDNTNDSFLSQNFEGTRWNEWESVWTGIEILDQQRSRTFMGTAPLFRVDPIGNMDFDTIVGETHTDRILVTENFVRTGQRTRTGIQTSITSTITEERLGERIVDISVIPFMRATQIAVVANSLKPNTQVYIFFDDVNVSSLVTGSSPYVVSGVLKTDAAGTFSGVLNIPNPNSSSVFKFRTGNKIVKITDSPLNEVFTSSTMAEGIFSSSGTINTIEETVARIRNFELQTQIVSETQTITSNPVNRIVSNTLDTTVVTWVDPLAQTFLVDPSVYKEGAFLSKVKLFFRSKDTALPVTVQIRPTVNGFPHSSFVMPFGSKTILPASVSVPPSDLNNNNAQILNYGTTFEFDSPIYLQPGEYSVVILSNSNKYEVYTSEIGQKKLGSTEVISEQPYAGSFFTSQNSSTWTPEQNMDLMFELNICEFSTNTSVYAEFVENKPYSDTTYINVMKIGDTIQTFPSCSLAHSYISKNVADVSYDLSVNNFVSVSPNNNVFMRQEKEITNEASENFRYRTIMRTTNKFVSPIIDSERTNLICVENLVNDATDIVSFTHASTDGPVFVSGDTQTIGANSGIVYDSELIRFVFNGSDANVVSAGDDSITISNHGFLTGNRVIYGNGGGTSIVGLTNSTIYYVIKVDNDTIKLANSAANAVAGSAVDITALGIGTTHVIISESGKVYLKKTSSGTFAPTETFSSSNAVLCTITSVSSETDAEFGGSETRYFTRVANLKNNNDYLKVYLTAHKPVGTDIKVYYKAAKIDDSQTINTLPYVEMVQEDPNVNMFSNSEKDLIEFVFSPEEATSIGEFNRLVIKIVLLSNNKCVIPFVDDMRAIVLDME